MNLIRLPLPDNYIYIDTDKIVSMEFNAYNGELTLTLTGEINRVFYDSSKRILDAIIEATNCRDGIPSIPKKDKPTRSIKQPIETNYYEVTPI
jgi:hypothetical protein